MFEKTIKQKNFIAPEQNILRGITFSIVLKIEGNVNAARCSDDDFMNHK